MDVLSLFSRFPRPLRSWRVVVALLLYRLVLCLTMRTAESPDEWWQSEEVAYFMVFGRGQLTWEWTEGLRSYVFPLFYAAPLYLLKWTGLDTATTVWAALRCVQALIFVLHDYVTLALAQRLDYLAHKARKASAQDSKTSYGASSRGPTVASATLAMIVVAWFLNYDGVRCYSNVAESLFFLLALYHPSYRGFLLWAGVACAVRVTAAFALLPVFGLHTYQICRRKGVARGLSYLLLVTVGMVGTVGAVTCAIDYVFYERLVITPLQFLRFNILMDVSRYYGVHPAYWYAVVLPLLAAPFSLFLLFLPSVWNRLPAEGATAKGAGPQCGLIGVSQPDSRPRSVQREIRRWAIVVACALLCHSAVAHKEMRFVYLLLPLVLVLSSVVVVVGCTTVTPAPASRAHRWGLRIPRPSMLRRFFTLFWLINLALMLFVLYGYRRGGPTILREVRRSPRHFAHLEILTHCYATPGFAHVHGKVDRLEWVDCPMKLDPVTLVREITQDRLFTEQPGPYGVWRYLRQRTPLTFAAGADPSAEGKLTEREWWAAMEKMMPQDVPPSLPDGLIVFHDTAKLLEDSLLLPKGYRLESVVAHAPYSFEPNEDRTIELWVRETS